MDHMVDHRIINYCTTNCTVHLQECFIVFYLHTRTSQAIAKYCITTAIKYQGSIDLFTNVKYGTLNKLEL
jgi:hypothetical protein